MSEANTAGSVAKAVRYTVKISELDGCWEVVQQAGAGRGNKTQRVGRIQIPFHYGDQRLLEAVQFLLKKPHTDAWEDGFHQTP